MIRFLTFLLGRPYETCKSCETLKEQLVYERDNNKQLTDTLLKIISPKAIEANPIEIAPITQSAGLFSRRRAALEERDRQEARILSEGKHIGRPDILKSDYVGSAKIEKLEKELGVEEKEA